MLQDTFTSHVQHTGWQNIFLQKQYILFMCGTVVTAGGRMLLMNCQVGFRLSVQCTSWAWGAILCLSRWWDTQHAVTLSHNLQGQHVSCVLFQKIFGLLHHTASFCHFNLRIYMHTTTITTCSYTHLCVYAHTHSLTEIDSLTHTHRYNKSICNEKRMWKMRL